MVIGSGRSELVGRDTTRTMIGEVVEQVGGGEEKGFAEWSSRLLDLRGVAPVPRFAGTEGGWEDFRHYDGASGDVRLDRGGGL